MLKSVRGAYGIAAIAGAVALAACASKPNSVAPTFYALEISNASSFNIDVFTIRSPGSTPTRLASAVGIGTTKLRIPQDAIQSSGDLVLALHAIGSSSTWQAPAILVDAGSTVRVEIFANPSGYLGRSSVYLVQNDTT
ncbi:MAG: hypothetical protein M3081_15885 [Gemmatimonadota bacterium]|nr:hypothetical protein [Gemmatimonadota bacterium]